MKLKSVVKQLAVGLCFLLSGIHAYGQNISLSFSDAPLAEVLHSIEDQTECSFIYEMADMDKAPKVSVELHNVSLSSALNEILRPPMRYEMKGKIVTISYPRQ